MGSGKVSVVVRNKSKFPIFLKKKVQVAQVVSASPVPPVELSSEMEAALGGTGYVGTHVCDRMTGKTVGEARLGQPQQLDFPECCHSSGSHFSLSQHFHAGRE